MVDYPRIEYKLTVSSMLDIPLSSNVPTRSAEAFSWETSKLLDFVLRDATTLSRDTTRLQALRRFQSRDGKWTVIEYTETVARDRVPRQVRLTACQSSFREEFGDRQNAAQFLSGKISKILYEIDPMNLNGDAPKDEYDSEAKDIAQRILIVDENLSTELLREVFESWFSRGCCAQDVYERLEQRLRPVIHE